MSEFSQNTGGGFVFATEDDYDGLNGVLGWDAYNFGDASLGFGYELVGPGSATYAKAQSDDGEGPLTSAGTSGVAAASPLDVAGDGPTAIGVGTINGGQGSAGGGSTGAAASGGVAIAATNDIADKIMLADVNIFGQASGNQGEWQDYYNIYHLLPNSIQWRVHNTPDGPMAYANLMPHKVRFNTRGENGKIIDSFVQNVSKLSFAIPMTFVDNNIDLELKFSDAWDEAMSTIDDYFQYGDERLRNPVHFQTEFLYFLGQTLITQFGTHGIEVEFNYTENVPLSTPKYTDGPNH